MLAGDAAGFIDPMTGDGLRFAIQGGELAAAAALGALEHGWSGVHEELARARARAFAAKWRFNRALRLLGRRHRPPSAAWRSPRASPRRSCGRSSRTPAIALSRAQRSAVASPRQVPCAPHGDDMSPWLTLLIVALPMAIEARRARGNEQRQRARGGIEPAGDVYPVMRVAYPSAFLLMIVEGAWRGPAAPAWIAAGAIVFAAAKALKWWAIASLGSSWTFRVLVVPGDPLVRAGPYRYLAHPNYVGVVGELAGVALITGARIAGPLAVVGFGVLIGLRVAVERRALDAILRRS